MRARPRGMRLLAVVAAAACGALAGAAVVVDTRAQRLETVRAEMQRLESELAGLSAREKSLLGDVTRMDTEIALRRAQLEEVTLRLRETEARLETSERGLAAIASARARRAPLLAARLRDLYKRGPVGMLARALTPLGTGSGLDGFRYASYLSRRDAGRLASWRDLSRRLGEEREALSVERARLASLRSEAVRRESALTAGRTKRAALLARIRGDREQHEKAFGELSEAAKNLSRLVDALDGATAYTGLDVRKFRGLLDWPAAGPVVAGFGTLVHPRFKTEVPHPGWDIDAPEGQPFRTIFDGRVAYAAPLSGYGLTAVVDHGNGMVSIYAHAGVLMVEAGQDVERGQELGRVGDSGSLRGPYLYFEMREGGRPVDPAPWLRRR